jgi:hypothetical protein
VFHYKILECIFLETHHAQHTYAHTTSMSTFKKLSQLDLEIHEVGHQEHLTIDGDVTSH